ncbi:MAG: D-sedoheptulose 7-phosphate isomerase [Rhizobacter sp.]|nr:D-sedoheptulose 7-phosphate isomerase [Rhizobacter sp.]
MSPHIRQTLLDARAALDALLANDGTLQAIDAAGALLCETFQREGRAFSCGNGGSMCDAMHFAEELSGRYRLDRPALGATAISDVTHMSCVGNDYGYEQVFSRYVEGNGRQGDVLLGISTSGTSGNVVAAARVARAKGMKVIALTGKPGATLGTLADIEICTPGGKFADRVQELHVKVIHILIESVERRLFPQNYTAA